MKFEEMQASYAGHDLGGPNQRILWIGVEPVSRPYDTIATIDDPEMEGAYELAQVFASSVELRDALKAIEQWEADLLMDDSAWVNGLPVFTQELYDRWIEVQAMRNNALAKADGKASVKPVFQSESQSEGNSNPVTDNSGEKQ